MRGETGRPGLTLLLAAMAGGDGSARDRVFEATYGELRRIAAAHMRRQPANHTLQPTALVNEAFLRLIDAPAEGWAGSGHFFAIASKAMRSVLVDHARSRRRLKRGVREAPGDGGDGLSIAVDDRALDAVDLDDALRGLARQDERAAAVAELRCFGGRTVPEIAAILGISRATAERDWSLARAWLKRAMS